MKKLIVFDWNGTLLSDTQACMDADNHVLKAFGGKPVDLKKYRDTINIPAVDFYVKNGCDHEEIIKQAKKVGETFHAFYEPRASKCRTRQGAKQLLNWLRNHSIESIILSNHTDEGINDQLKRLKINHLISKILANSSIGTSVRIRNKMEKLQEYLKIHKYKLSNVFIVGDSPEETEIGKKLGVHSVAITDGYYAEARLKASKPDFLIHSLYEFQKIIESSG